MSEPKKGGQTERRFCTTNSGDVFGAAEARTRALAAAETLEAAAKEAREFVRKLDAGEDLPDDCFLDVQAVGDNGWDRTGPDPVVLLGDDEEPPNHDEDEDEDEEG